MINPAPFSATLPKCPRCGQEGQKAIGDLVRQDLTACVYCGADIDLTDHKWRSSFKELVEGIKELRRLK